MNKVIILIDGSNFYFKLKDLQLHDLLKFDFTKFIGCLSQKNQIVATTFYIGKVRTDGTTKAQNLFNQQRKLLAHLKKHTINYSLGYLLTSEGKFHEKGVDVNLAVDILVATYENLCDQLIIISSDTDLLPAIKKAKEKGKLVEYVGFSHQPSLALIKNSSRSRLLTKQEIEQFLI